MLYLYDTLFSAKAVNLSLGGSANVASAGTDASTAFAVGSGGASPTAVRTAEVQLNAASSGSFVGATRVSHRRAGTTIWDVGINNVTSSGAKGTVNTDLYWHNGTSYVMALSAAGVLTTPGGFDLNTNLTGLRYGAGDTGQVVVRGGGTTSATFGANGITLAPAVTVSGAFLSVGTNPSATGAVRLPNNNAVKARGVSNTVDLSLLSLDTSNVLVLGENSASLVGVQIQYPTSTTTSFVRNGATVVTVGNGVVVGGAAGGDIGGGFVNVSGGIRLNNTAYTNPGYVFEHAYTGRVEAFAGEPGAAGYTGLPSLDETRRVTVETLELPGMDHGDDLFRRAAFTLEKLEELYLHVFEIDDRLKALEGAR